MEKKLSKYWRKRAARRAKMAERTWPNKKDRDWALEEQDKSTKMNDRIHNLFEKELEESDRKSTRLNSSHVSESRMPSSA